jgi:hypothetical protein
LAHSIRGLLVSSRVFLETGEKMTEYYPFFWALCLVIAVFIVVILDIMRIESHERNVKRRTKLRDKLHLAAKQNQEGFA